MCMIFFTIVFFIMSARYIIKGRLFHTSLIRLGELNLIKSQSNMTKFQEKVLKNKILELIIPQLLIFIPLIIANIIYLVQALNIDIYKYPTISMIILFVIQTFSNKNENNDLSSEEKRLIYKSKIYQKRTTYNTIRALINLNYYGYMFYILVLMK